MRRLLDTLGRHGAGRLIAVAVPLLTVLAALGGALVDAVVPAVVAALLLGAVGAWFVGGVVAARRRSLQQQVADARTELAGERARNERLLEELPAAVILLRGGAFHSVNRAARDLFGITSATGDADLATLGLHALAGAVEEVAETGRPIDVEFDRDERMLTARASAFDDKVLLVVRDITGVRRLDAVRRDFVVNASHELKTPVAGIQALAESLALALRHNPSRATRMVTRIEHEAARLARLVRDLLDLARLEEPSSAQQRRRVNVAEVVRSQLDRLRPLATERDITIEADLPMSSVVVAVPEDIRSIVANLLENAVRYNREGGTVTVGLTREGGGVTFQVTDTGEGIPEADRDRVFERFYRVDKARSRAAGGTGLGLSLVRHAAERHGGSVTLHSEVGVGSTFRVQLPVAGA